VAKNPPTREATKQETREALVRAGALEFAEKGLDGPSLDAICERAGFTRGAFYVHFRDRDDLLVAVVDRVLERFQRAVIASTGAPDDLRETIGRYVRAVVEGDPVPTNTPKWAFHDTLAACARLPVLRDRYRALQEGAIDQVARAAAAGQRAGTVRRDVTPKAIAEILVVLTLGIGAMLDAGIPFDLLGDAGALAKLIAPPRCAKTKR
jgi:AcrR family transcriptional regulator